MEEEPEQKSGAGGVAAGGAAINGYQLAFNTSLTK